MITERIGVSSITVRIENEWDQFASGVGTLCVRMSVGFALSREEGVLQVEINYTVRVATQVQNLAFQRSTIVWSL